MPAQALVEGPLLYFLLPYQPADMVHTNRLMISHPNLCLDETESVQTPLRVYSNALEIERCPVENLVICRFSFFPWAQLKVGKCAGVQRSVGV